MSKTEKHEDHHDHEKEQREHNKIVRNAFLAWLDVILQEPENQEFIKKFHENNPQK